MVDYDTYVQKFGTRSGASKERRVSISREIYNLLSKKLAVAFENEVNLSIMEDVLIRISTAMMNDDKDKDKDNATLKTWKKVSKIIKEVLEKYKDKEDILNDRYYQVSLSPSERDKFLDNPIVIDGAIVGSRQAAGIIAYGKFYRAMCTDVGEAVRIALVEAQYKAIEELYEAKQKNGTSSYYNALKEICSNWSRRIGEYESYSGSLKISNRSIANG